MGNLNSNMKKKHFTISVNRTESTPVHDNSNALGVCKNQILQPQPQDGRELSTTEDLCCSKNDEGEDLLPPIPKRKKNTQPGVAYAKKPLSIPKNKKYDQQFFKWIVKGYHSFRLVEETEFQILCKKMCPNYNLTVYWNKLPF